MYYYQAHMHGPLGVEVHTGSFATAKGVCPTSKLRARFPKAFALVVTEEYYEGEQFTSCSSRKVIPFQLLQDGFVLVCALCVNAPACTRACIPKPSGPVTTGN